MNSKYYIHIWLIQRHQLFEKFILREESNIFINHFVEENKNFAMFKWFLKIFCFPCDRYASLDLTIYL